MRGKHAATLACHIGKFLPKKDVVIAVTTPPSAPAQVIASPSAGTRFWLPWQFSGLDDFPFATALRREGHDLWLELDGGAVRLVNFYRFAQTQLLLVQKSPQGDLLVLCLAAAEYCETSGDSGAVAIESAALQAAVGLTAVPVTLSHAELPEPVWRFFEEGLDPQSTPWWQQPIGYLSLAAATAAGLLTSQGLS